MAGESKRKRTIKTSTSKETQLRVFQNFITSNDKEFLQFITEVGQVKFEATKLGFDYKSYQPWYLKVGEFIAKYKTPAFNIIGDKLKFEDYFAIWEKADSCEAISCTESDFSEFARRMLGKGEQMNPKLYDGIEYPEAELEMLDNAVWNLRRHAKKEGLQTPSIKYRAAFFTAVGFLFTDRHIPTIHEMLQLLMEPLNDDPINFDFKFSFDLFERLNTWNCIMCEKRKRREMVLTQRNFYRHMEYNHSYEPVRCKKKPCPDVEKFFLPSDLRKHVHQFHPKYEANKKREDLLRNRRDYNTCQSDFQSDSDSDCNSTKNTPYFPASSRISDNDESSNSTTTFASKINSDKELPKSNDCMKAKPNTGSADDAPQVLDIVGKGRGENERQEEGFGNLLALSRASMKGQQLLPLTDPPMKRMKTASLQSPKYEDFMSISIPPAFNEDLEHGVDLSYQNDDGEHVMDPTKEQRTDNGEEQNGQSSALNSQRSTSSEAEKGPAVKPVGMRTVMLRKEDLRKALLLGGLPPTSKPLETTIDDAQTSVFPDVSATTSSAATATALTTTEEVGGLQTMKMCFIDSNGEYKFKQGVVIEEDVFHRVFMGYENLKDRVATVEAKLAEYENQMQAWRIDGPVFDIVLSNSNDENANCT